MINGDHNVIPPAGGKAGGPQQGPAKTRRGTRPEDAVEITARSGSEAHEIRQPGPKVTESEMSETIARVRIQLRERIRSGFYDSEEVLGSIAGKILGLFGM